MPRPLLRLALPRSDGSLLLDFEDDAVAALGREDFDADDFEHLCRDAGQCVAEDASWTGPQLHFRWEWGGEHWPLG